MKMKKIRIGAMLCGAAILLCTAANAASPAFTADSSGVSNSNAVAAFEDGIAESGRMAAIRIEGGNPYVFTTDVAMQASADDEEIVISGEVGESFVVGDLIFEIVSEEEVQAATADSMARASTKRWEIDLSGDAMSKDFEVTSAYPYAKVWISNNGSRDIKFTITKNSPTGSVVAGSKVSIPAGSPVSVYSSKPWSAATYYANFTSGQADMIGTAACRVASTIEELDV